MFFVCFVWNGNHHSDKAYKLDALRASKKAVDKGMQEKTQKKERSQATHYSFSWDFKECLKIPASSPAEINI